MTTSNNTISPINENQSQSVNLRDTFNKYVYHWPVFIFSILLCIALAFFYLRYTPKIYSVNTTLLIKDNKSGGSGAGSELFSELDIFGSSKVVDNEIEILKSKSLMRKVVDRLNLTIAYKQEGRVVNSDRYSNRPVDVSIIKLSNEWYGRTLTLSFPNENTYLLTDKQSDEKISGLLNQLKRNSLGIVKISRNPNFKKLSDVKLDIVISDPEILVDQLLANLTISLAGKQSTVINLNLQSSVPQKGRDVLNTLIQVYNEAAFVDKNKTTQSTIQFIDERLKLISGELTDVEKDVEGFKSSRGIVDIGSDANMFLENVKVNDAKLNEINLQISVIRDIQRFVNSESSQGKLPSTFGINDPILLNQINQLGELFLKRDQLLGTTTKDNPLVAPISNQIEMTKESIKTSVNNIAQVLEGSKRGLIGNDNQFQSSIKNIPGQERQFISIKRQQSIKESLYLFLLQKKEEAALSYASAVSDSRTVDPAYSLKVPVSPNKLVSYFIALTAGIILAIAYVYGKSLLNNKINSVSEITRLTTTPLLGEISQKEDSEQVVVQSNVRTAIAEQFRSIRTNLQFLHGKQEEGSGNVTMFTSSMSGEGKSFVATNLAIALALSGKRTILLELDLRKPKVSKYLSLNSQIGLSNYLIGKAKAEDIIQITTLNPNFYVIGSGPIPPNPSELLIQKDLDVLISQLKRDFDEIIIDTPPIGLVTDAQIIGKVADVSIFIVRQDLTNKLQIENLDALHKSLKLPKLTFILNGVKSGGAYGYGYGYGYYTDDHKAHQFSISNTVKNILRRF